MAGRAVHVISRSRVEAALSIADAVRAVESALRACGEGRAQMPPKPYLYFDRGDLRCMPAFLPDEGLATVKTVNVHPGNRDLPSVMATVTVYDPETGRALAIMDGTYLTAMRTGAAGGVAAGHLARADARVASFIGCGRQAETQLAALLETMAGLASVLAADLDADRAERFAARAARKYGLRAEACPAERAAREADVLTTVTPSRRPVVRAEWVRPGTHVNAIGADAPGKQELEADLLRAARLVVDSWEQAAHGGEINMAVRDGLITRDDVHAEIGQVVAGKASGRASDEEITVFDSTGLAVQDCACAAHVYRRLEAQGWEGALSVDFDA